MTTNPLLTRRARRAFWENYRDVTLGILKERIEAFGFTDSRTLKAFDFYTELLRENPYRNRGLTPRS